MLRSTQPLSSYKSLTELRQPSRRLGLHHARRQPSGGPLGRGRGSVGPRLPLTGWSALLVLVAIACGHPAPSGQVGESLQLRSGTVDVRSLAVDEVARYRVALAEGDILHLRVEQRGLDVALRWADETEPVDLPYGQHVTEELWRVARRPQDLKLEISASAGAGDYRLVVEILGTADGTDSRRARAFTEERAGLDSAQANHLDVALNQLQAAQKLWHDADTPVREALVLAEMSMLFADQKRFDEALTQLEDAIRLLDSRPEVALMGRFLYELGNLRYERGEIALAIGNYQAAADKAQGAGDRHGEAKATVNLATVREDRGELKLACEGYDHAQSLWSSIDIEKAAEQRVHHGQCLSKLGVLPEALPILLGALEVAETIPSASRLRAKALLGIGWWYHLDSQPEEALENLLRAFEIEPELYGLFDRLGTVYSQLGELSTARQFYAKALERALGTGLDEAHVRLNLCRLDLRSDRTAAGLSQCKQALVTFEELEAREAAAETLVLTAKLIRAEDLHEAERLAQRAVALIESQRPLTGSPDRMRAFLAERLEAHHLLVELRMALHTREPGAGWDRHALVATELTRARTLIEFLRSEEIAPAELQDLTHRLTDVRRDRHNIAPRSDALYPANTVTIPEVRELLDSETMIVVYHLGEDEAYRWLVTRSRVEGRSLTDPHRIGELARSWYEGLSDPGITELSTGLQRQRASLLSQLILEPIAGDIAQYRRLVIVADGPLRRIPFAALSIPGEPSTHEPLVNDHEIVGLPSLSMLKVLRAQAAQREPSCGLLAVVADPLYTIDNAPPPTSLPSSPSAPGYPRLPGSAEEARALLALARNGSTRLLERSAANREAVLAGALENYRIIHFATHTQTEENVRDPIGLLLSLYNTAGEPIEGHLGLQDIYGLRLPAELVVLSACNTAFGEEVRGEGLIGLTRGFMHAGASRVVVSLWAVQDQAARELMSRFYRHLLEDGAAPAEALRRAQNTMRLEGWASRHWAAFVLQGDWQLFPVTLLGD